MGGVRGLGAARGKPRSAIRPSLGTLGLLGPGGPFGSAWQACMLDLSFRSKVLSLPKGRAQEYCLLAPAWTCLLYFRAGFRPFRAHSEGFLGAWLWLAGGLEEGRA